MIEQETERISAKEKWTIADLVDFEVLLGEDERLRRELDGGEALIEQTDRAVYRDHIKQHDPGVDGPMSPDERRRLIFRAWLDERRKLDERREPTAARPLLGRSFAEVQAQARTLLAVAGVGCGIVVVTLHSYFGNLRVMSSGVPEPASVLSYLGVCVLLPALLVLAGVLLIRNTWHLGDRLGVRPLFKLLARMISKLVTLLVFHAADNLKQEDRERLRAGMATIAARVGEHRSAIKWPFLLTLQSFGLGFAASIPLTTLLLMAGSDRGFGWQTSMTRLITPESIERGVRVASFPWRWIPVAWASQPNAEAIRSSHVTYISGGKNLTDEALKSWGPFLVLCTAVWGFLPRVALFLFALLGQRKALATLPLDDLRCHRLFRDLTTSLRAPPKDDGGTVSPPPPVNPPPAHIPIPCGECVALVSYDVNEVVEKNFHLLEALLARHTGWTIHRSLVVGGSAAENRKVLTTLEQLEWMDARERQVLYLQDASAPPIKAVLDFFSECRNAAGQYSRLTIGLIGTPKPGVPFPLAGQEDVAVWQRRIDTLGDLRIGLLQLTA